MNLYCIGLSHHTADVATRERYAGLTGFENLRDTSGCEEALLLSTCNRVEIYAVAARSLPADSFGSEIGSTAVYRHEGDDCVQHLFRVVSGLDSMVVGETEILGQTKRAYEESRGAGGAGPYLHRLFQRAFRVAKQVRTHTQITRGAVSVGSVAVDLAQKIFGELKGRRVLLLGAGETGERTARALVSRGVRDLRIGNRSQARAEELAQLVGGRSVPFDRWPAECREVDILITSTAAPAPIMDAARLGPLLRERVDRPLFIIDIAVPRNVAPEVNEMSGVYLYDIDSLQVIAAQSLALRRQQMAAAEEIIATHVADFREWLRQGGQRGHQTSTPELSSGTLPAEL